ASREDLPNVRFTTSYDEMLSMPEVEIVAIYTPDAHHGQHIEQAMRAGKDVICTKPLVISIDDAIRVRRAARETGRRLLVGQSTRFFEPFLRQRRAYEAGEIGDLELVDAHYVHRMDWYYRKSPWAATETDWVFLGMSHPLDLLRWYLGPIDTVHATATTSAVGREFGLRGHDVYLVSVVAKDGRLGRAMGHYGIHELPRARNCIECLLCGTSSTSLAQYHDMRYLHLAPDGTEVVEDHLYAGRHYYFNSEVHGMHYGEFANSLEHFALSLIHDEPHHPDLDEGLETFCLMEGVRTSVETGRVVEIDPILARTMGD
ncbi:MAG: Gfo/Idh/MocA family oxidoreductase, partial [Phycisphaerales bacterium]|nr:Gfo/Idh/MocA family oxidoreductase [Phycisphaerales bacterium]